MIRPSTYYDRLNRDERPEARSRLARKLQKAGALAHRQEFLARLAEVEPWGQPATWFDPEGISQPSVVEAMPPGTPWKLRLAKMGQLIRRGLVDGCFCGCRGDFYITDAGREFLARTPPEEAS